MIIVDTDINTYGLQLLEVTGLFDLPKRKKILKEPGFEAKDIKHEIRKIRVKVGGKFSDASTLASNVKSFQEKVGKSMKQFQFPDHGVNFYGIARNGMKVKINKNVVVCTFEIFEE